MYVTANPSHVEVLRPISGRDDLNLGQIVDASGWSQNSLRGLLNHRYVKPFYGIPSKKAVAASAEPSTLADDLTP